MPSQRFFMLKYKTKHRNMMMDPEFIKHVFAFCTDYYLKNMTEEDKLSTTSRLMVTRVLHLGFIMKCYSIEDREKDLKYNFDIETDRGIINCLFREAVPFCQCMRHLKLEAKKCKN